MLKDSCRIHADLKKKQNQTAEITIFLSQLELLACILSVPDIDFMMVLAV